MASFVTELAKYKCPCNVFGVRESQDKVSWNGKKVLTTSAKLEPEVPLCSILSAQLQTPTECKKRFSPWQPADVRHRADGNFLLTASSIRMCALTGQQITLLFDAGNPAGNFAQAGIDLPGMEEPSQANASHDATGDEASCNAKAEPVAPTPAVSSQESADNGPAEQENGKSAYLCKDCNRKCGLPETWLEEFRSKEPDWDSAPLEVAKKDYRKRYLGTLPKATMDKLSGGEDNSLKAFKNLKPKEDSFLENIKSLIKYEKGLEKGDEDYVKAMQQLKEYASARSEARAENFDEWGFQCHHVISANQVFLAKSLEGKLMQMAHVCKYEINNGKNCMMLVAPDSDEDYDIAKMKNKMEQSEKEEKNDNLMMLAYQLMDRTRMQWHKGPHNYSLSKSEVDQLIKRYPENKVVNFRNYVTAILEDPLFKDIINSIDKSAVCPADFIVSMHMLSQNIKKSISAFGNNYRESYPFYVSKAALFFAHQMPSHFTIMTVCRSEKNYILRIMKCSLDETGKKKISNTKRDKHEYPDNATPDDKKKCIKFCRAHRHFLFFGQSGDSRLPFTIDPNFIRKEGCGKYTSIDEINNYLINNMEEIMWWLQKTPVADEPEITVARERVKELKSKEA